MSNTISDYINAWIHSTPPVRAELGSDDAAATARATFLGQDNSDPQAKGEAIYTDAANLPTAVASILNRSQDQAQFHPASSSPEQLAEAFVGYVLEIDKNPFFHLLNHERQRQVFDSSDYNVLIDQVVNLYKGVAQGELNSIKDAIARMATSVFGEEHSDVFKNLFSQSTLDLSTEGNPKFYIYYTSLHMMHDRQGKSEVSKQEYEVRMTTYQVLPDLIKAHAKSLAALDKKSVDDWLGESTSPERSGAKLCFPVKPFVAPQSVSL